MALSKQQQSVLNASRGYIKAKGAAVKAFQGLCGDDLATDAAKVLVSELLTAIRTIGGVVASVKACSEAKSGPMARAGRDYWAITKSFTRAKAELIESPERVKVGFADGILRDAQKIVERIQKATPEKLTFEASAAIAGFQSAMGKVRATK
jgi:hypothetical protein